MKAIQISYERVKSCNFNNEKIGIILEVEEGERASEVLEQAKIFVKKEFDERVTREITEEDIPF